ncbi:MAG: hypothetical protein JWP52_1356 [Rhizobacter sp.]|nr:hypothetical protein [Rhizobacter sp.]
MIAKMTWPALAASVFLLTACGGGGDDGASPAGPTGSVLSIGGTAATGAAIAGGAVEVKCATGTGTATTATNGSYAVSIAGGALPCALRVKIGTTVLHSVLAAGSSASVTANITPLTELLVARLSAGAPDTLFTTFDATAQGRLTSAAVTAAIASTKAALAGAVDLTGIDPIKDALVAAAPGAAGNALDGLLDKLGAALAKAQISLDQLSAAIVAGGDTAQPALTLLQPAAASCAALHSGKYRVINPHETIDDPDSAAMLVNIDATALKVSADGNTTDSIALTPDPASACRFIYAGDFGTEVAMVSPSGVIAVLSPSVSGPIRTSLMIPEQAIAVSALAGNWNYLGYLRDGKGPLAPVNGSAVIDANGKFVSGSECTTVTACEAWGAPMLEGTLTVNPKGGFVNSVTKANPSRVFAFMTAEGAISMFILEPNEEGLTVFTQQKTLALPAVGKVDKFWDFTVGSGAFRWAPTSGAQGVISAQITDSTTTVTSVDATAGSYLRRRESDERIDGFTVNQPRAGLRFRAAGNVPTKKGPIAAAATVTMPLTGTGVTLGASVTPDQNFFTVSVVHP